MGFNALLSLEFFGGAVSLRVDDGTLRASLKTGAAFLAQVGIDVEANLAFAFDRALRALLGAGAACDTVVTDAIGHGYKSNAIED